MNGLREKFRNKKGFTLIEMLIVVAIIAILIAVSIPLVSGALEKARDATDQANERAAKAEAILYYMGTVSDDELKKIDATYVPGNAFTAVYDAQNGGLVKDGTGIKAYGQCTKNGECYKGSTGKDTQDHTKGIIQVTVTAEGKVTTSWIAAS